MPPYDQMPNRVIWQYVGREVVVREDATLPGRHKQCVVMIFTRSGYMSQTQERVNEDTGECVVAVGLTKAFAHDLRRTVEQLGSRCYDQGYYRSVGIR